MSKKIVGVYGIVLSGTLFTLCVIPFGFSLFKLLLDHDDTEDTTNAYKVVAFTATVPTTIMAGSIYLVA
jgi:hypothetical protein